MNKIIHLHHLWNSTGTYGGAAALRGVISGFAVCGECGVQRDKLTAFLDDTTCPECIKRARPTGDKSP